MSKFRWAYLGCGGIAHTTAKQLKNSADNEIVAVWNRTQKRRKTSPRNLAEKFMLLLRKQSRLRMWTAYILR